MKNKAPRLTWPETKKWVRGLVGPHTWYAVIEPASGLYVNCHSLFELHATICASPSFREDPKAALSNLQFFRGRPIVAVDLDAATAISHKRRKLKLQEFGFFPDDHGAMLADKRINLNITEALADYAKFLEARKKVHELRQQSEIPGASEPAGSTPSPTTGDPVSGEVPRGESTPTVPSGSNQAQG